MDNSQPIPQAKPFPARDKLGRCLKGIQDDCAQPRWERELLEVVKTCLSQGVHSSTMLRPLDQRFPNEFALRKYLYEQGFTQVVVNDTEFSVSF